MLILVVADKHNILTIFFYYVDDALCIKSNNNSYIIKRIQKLELTDNKRLTTNVNKSLCCSDAKSCTHSRTADDNGNIRLFNHGHPPLQQLPQKICTSFIIVKCEIRVSEKRLRNGSYATETNRNIGHARHTGIVVTIAHNNHYQPRLQL